MARNSFAICILLFAIFASMNISDEDNNAVALINNQFEREEFENALANIQQCELLLENMFCSFSPNQ